MIVERAGKFCVLSEDGGRSFGCYGTKREAQERMNQIEMFKHMAQTIPALSVRRRIRLAALDSICPEYCDAMRAIGKRAVSLHALFGAELFQSAMLKRNLTESVRVSHLVFDKEDFALDEIAEIAPSFGAVGASFETEQSIRVAFAEAQPFESVFIPGRKIPEGVRFIFEFLASTEARQSDPNAPIENSAEQSRLRQELEISTITQSAAGATYEVTIIKSGESLDGVNIFPAEVLKQAIADGLFENIPVYQFEFDGRTDHLSRTLEERVMPSGLFRNYAGFIRNARWDEHKSAIKGDLTLVDPTVASKIEIIRQAGIDHAGLSIVADVDRMPSILNGGKRGFKVVKFSKVKEVDIVSFPAAGGEFERLVASFDPDSIPLRDYNKNMLGGNSSMDKILIERALHVLGKLAPEIIKQSVPDSTEQLLSLIGAVFASGVVKQSVEIDALMALRDAIVATVTKEEAIAAVEALIAKMEAEPAVDSNDPKPTPDVESNSATPAVSRAEFDALQQSIKRQACASMLDTRLTQSVSLTEAAKKAIRKQFTNRVFAEKELNSAIVDMSDVLGSATTRQSSAVASTEFGHDMLDRIQAGIDLLIGIKHEDTRIAQSAFKFRGIRHAYETLTGDEDVRGVKDWSRVNTDVRQAMSSANFPLLLGNSMTKRLSMEYARRSGDWRKLVRVTSAANFLTQETIRMGGFTDIPVVSENNSYTEVTSPSEERSTWEIATRGILAVVSRRMLKNDNLNAIRNVPDKLAYSAAMTIWKRITEALENFGAGSVNGGTIYTGGALYTAGQGNLISAALSHDNLAAARIAMRKFTEPNSLEVLNIMPKYLVVPPDLEPVATILLESEKRPGINHNDINVNRGKLELVENPYLRQSDLPGDCSYVVADPDTCETITVGFLDGREEPDLILQSGDTEGNTFSRDQWTWKCRYEFGLAVSDWRAFVGMIPA